MKFIMDNNFNTITRYLSYLNHLPGNMTFYLEYSKELCNNTFDIDLIEDYIFKIKNLLPNQEIKFKITYRIDNHHNLKESANLKHIDNHLSKHYNSNLFITAQNGKIYSYENVIKANTKLNKVIDEISSLNIDGTPLSNYEKLFLIYNYVTKYVYNSDENNYSSSNYWIPVITGDKIVCNGYSSLFKTLCDKMFNDSDVKVFEQSLNVYKKNSDQLEAKHSNNLIFLKDDKYNIDGLFYIDACWDSCKTNGSTSNFAFFCLPIKDILYYKYNDFCFNSFINIYLNQYEDYSKNNKKSNSINKIHEMFFESLHLKDKDFVNYYNQRFKNLHFPSTIPTKKEKLKNYLMFMTTLNRLTTNHIPYEAIENSYKIIGKSHGFKGKLLDAYVKNKLKNSYLEYNLSFDTSKCKHTLADLNTYKKRS